MIVVIFMLSLSLLVGCSIDSSTQNGGQNNPEQGKEETENNDSQKEITTMYLLINGNKLEVTLAKNSSVDALIELLQQDDITYTADDYGGFEKVGGIGHTLPRNDTQIKTEAGDVILYQGNQICLFVGSNSWSYTRIGKINGYTVSELRNLLCAGEGSIQVTISLK